MICENCKKGKVVLHAFSNGKCQKCDCDVQTAHIPCDKLCDGCSDKHNCCKECGCDIQSDDNDN